MRSFPRIKKHFRIKESDITIITDSEKYVKIARNYLIRIRSQLEEVIRKHPEFKTSFSPITIETTFDVVVQMQNAAILANVGPMASVAGVFADAMCDEMIRHGAQIAVVENGGEIKIHSIEDIFINLYSKTTNLKNTVSFLFRGGSDPLGIATSSGTFGHATSLGEADTVTVCASSAGIADAAATKIANSVKRNETRCILEPTLELAKSMDFIKGVFITCGELVAKVGKIPELIISE
ncbi:MAG: UPF0280 family protein [Candidatus Lokiarchaeota archaeon]|nr:UPF0280 family protein [Candidatus Lokiarchaeota archaeon]